MYEVWSNRTSMFYTCQSDLLWPCTSLIVIKWKPSQKTPLTTIEMSLFVQINWIYSCCYSCVFFCSSVLMNSPFIYFSVFLIFTWLNRVTLIPVKWIKGSWIEVKGSRGHSHLTKCAVCMIGAEWLEFLLMWCNVMTLEYTVCFTHAHRLDWKINSLQWN